MGVTNFEKQAKMKQLTFTLKTWRTSTFNTNTGVVGKLVPQRNWFQRENGILLKFQCGFRKGYGFQHFLLMILETWKEASKNNKAFRALLTDLLKDFNCLSHDCFI